MMRANLKKIFRKAYKRGYALGAFNTSNLEITKAIISAAEEMNCPVIIETSEGEADYINRRVASAMVGALKKISKVPIFLNADHCHSFETAKAAVDAGYDMVQIDGSLLPYEKNIELTRKVVRYAHRRGILVEGELGYVEGSSRFHEEGFDIKKKALTDPQRAGDFVKKTRVDNLAVFIGNLHGVYKGGNPHLDIDRLQEIKERIKCFISLHGGSGTPEKDIRQARHFGIVKINVNTELRLAFTNALKKTVAGNKQQTTPYKLLPPVIEAVKEVVKHKIELFGSQI